MEASIVLVTRDGDSVPRAHFTIVALGVSIHIYGWLATLFSDWAGPEIKVWANHNPIGPYRVSDPYTA